jgi:hypothetical protein
MLAKGIPCDPEDVRADLFNMTMPDFLPRYSRFLRPALYTSRAKREADFSLLHQISKVQVVQGAKLALLRERNHVRPCALDADKHAAVERRQSARGGMPAM